MNPGFALDALLYRGREAPALPGCTTVATPQGPVRVFDSGGALPVAVLVPDGPNLVEHYTGLIERLSPLRRVVVLDLPGFGYSFPQAHYQHRLAQGGGAILAVLAALDLRAVTLACSCVNGYYAMAAAKLDREQRIARLLLSQTPSLAEMRRWTARIVPRPVRLPLLGQTINFAQRRKIAEGWLHLALARREDRPRFKTVAQSAFDQGACYCFASVVQGMAAEPESPELLSGLTLPCTLIWGGADRSHKPTDPASLGSLLPQAEIKVWPHRGHFPDLEDEVAFAAELLSR